MPPATKACPSGVYEHPPCEAKPGSHWCYKVYYGESLWSIGEAFGLDWKALCKSNEMKDCSCLFAEDTFLKMPIRQ
jgi:hypothetical protein